MFGKFPKISYSLLSNVGQEEPLENVLPGISYVGIDMIHYDVSENEKTLHLADLPKLLPLSPLPFDVHLSVKKPLNYIAKLKMRENDKFCIHVEDKLNFKQLKKLKKQLNCKFGLAINIETSIEDLFEFIPILDYVLFMTATPGVSGGIFNENTVNKIRIFKIKYPHICLHVDGGINRLSAALLRDIGVDVMISGSYILNGSSQTNQVTNLFGRNLLLPVKSIMRKESNLPIVSPNFTISAVAEEINKKKIGCACVLDKQKKLLGFITDGAIRRQLIKTSNLTDCKASDIMTQSPFSISPEQSLLSVFRTIDEKNLSFAAIPVIENFGQCVGVFWLQDVLFTDLL
jgi:ribulose-phosphate 3-epimerase